MLDAFLSFTMALVHSVLLSHHDLKVFLLTHRWTPNSGRSSGSWKHVSSGHWESSQWSSQVLWVQWLRLALNSWCSWGWPWISDHVASTSPGLGLQESNPIHSWSLIVSFLDSQFVPGSLFKVLLFSSSWLKRSEASLKMFFLFPPFFLIIKSFFPSTLWLPGCKGSFCLVFSLT